MENNMTNKTYTVQEFIKKYNSFTSEKAKETFLKSVIKNNYVDFLVKVEYARKIIELSGFRKETGKPHMDSCKQYLLYIFSIITMYTNIVMDEQKVHEEYDKLEKNHLIVLILSMLPEREIKMFDSILQMQKDDWFTNYHGFEHYLEIESEKGKTWLLKNMDTIIKLLSDRIQGLTEQDLLQVMQSLN